MIDNVVGSEEQVGMTMTMAESKRSSQSQEQSQATTAEWFELCVSICCDDGCGAAAEGDDVEVDSYDYGDCCRGDESKVTPIELKKQVREPECIMDELNTIGDGVRESISTKFANDWLE